jgi:hypothetical protein
LKRHFSAAECFGMAWEGTLNEVPLGEQEQAEVYRWLLAWVRSGELFTNPAALFWDQSERQEVRP